MPRPGIAASPEAEDRMRGRLQPRRAKLQVSQDQDVDGAHRDRDCGAPVLASLIDDLVSALEVPFADLVRFEGISCLELGADVPPEAFAGATTGAHRLVAVGIGVPAVSNLDAVRDTVRAIHAVVAAIPVVVGGQTATGARGPGTDSWAADGRQAIEIIEGLVRSRRKYWVVGNTDDSTSDAASGADPADVTLGVDRCWSPTHRGTRVRNAIPAVHADSRSPPYDL